MSDHKKSNYHISFRGIYIVILLALSFLTGCVSWRENHIKPVSDFPSTSLNSTIYLDLNASLKSNGISVISSEDFSKQNTEKFLKIAKDKILFKDISSERKDADYILKIDYESENNGFSGLSIATLFILPGVDRFEETMHVELRRTQDLQLLDNFTITEKGQNLYQILLLFAVPFTNTTRETYESAYQDLVENVLERIYSDIR